MQLKKLHPDLIANFASFAILAGSAVLANLVILAAYDITTLGIFNQVVGVFIVIAQISVFGQQNAMLHEGAHSVDDPNRLKASIAAAFTISTASALSASALLLLLSRPISNLLDSPQVETGLYCVAPALIFSAPVKLAMQTLNGMGRVRDFAVVQAARPLLMIVAFGVAVMVDLPASLLPLTMTFAEAGTMAIAIGLLRGACPARTNFAAVKERLQFMFSFGFRSLPAGLLAEVNTRVDYFVLGVFASDTVVGVYSFAAALAEGFFALVAVLRILLTPKLAQVIKDNDREEFKLLARRWKLMSGALGFSVFIISVPIYAYALQMFAASSELRQSITYYAALALGVALASAYIPFGNIILLTGRPGLHSLYFVGLVATNLVCNLILTPSFGAIGTATATMLCYIVSAIWLVTISRRTLGLPL